MDTGERKNIQARQSSDGTFELFVGQGGLEEISEDEVSFAEITAPSAPVQKQKSGKTIPIVIAAVLLLTIAITAGVLLQSDKTKSDDSGINEVQGFRAYRGNAPQKKTNPKINKRSSIKPVGKTELAKSEESEEEEQDDNVAWKLTGKEPTPANDVEARIQPNRNPTPESIAAKSNDKAAESEDVIDDENDDSKEIAAQKRLGFLPITPTVNKKTFQKMPKLNPNLIKKDIPKFDGIPKIQPTSERVDTEND